MKTIPKLFAGLWLLLALTAPAQSQWQLRYPLPTPRGLLGAIYANGLFVAVGYNNTILTSPDAVTWTLRTAEGPVQLTDVAYGNGQFVAVGFRGSSFPGDDNITLLLVSRDGLTWTEESPQPGFPLRRIIFANDLFVGLSTPLAAGDPTSVILTSPDGQTWTERSRYLEPPGGDESNLSYLVAEAKTILVVIPNAKSFTISTNSVDWREVPFPAADATVQAVASGGARFFAVASVLNGDQVDLEAWTSSDGENWTRQVIEGSSPVYVTAAALGNGEFLVLGYQNLAFRSADGSVWTKQPLTGLRFGRSGREGVDAISTLLYANGTFALVGQPQNGLGGPTGFARVFTSPDGANWTRRLGENYFPYQAASDGRGLVAISTEYVPGTSVLQSSDGTDWKESTVLTNISLYGIVYGDDKYVALADSGIFSSPDGVTWSQRDENLWGRLRFSSGSFLALGTEIDSENRILHYKFGSSADGLSWKTEKIENVENVDGLLDVASDGLNPVILASAPPGGGTRPTRVLLRSNGNGGWAEVYRGEEPVPDLLVFGNGRFVGIETYGSVRAYTVLVSEDGIKWTKHPPFTGGITDLIAAHGKFYAAELSYGEFRVFSSSDGVAWTAHQSGHYGMKPFASAPTLTASAQGLFAFGSGAAILHWPWDITLQAFGRLANGTVQFRVFDPIARPFEIQVTSTLSPPDWRTIPVTADLSDPTIVRETGASADSTRFYRAVSR